MKTESPSIEAADCRTSRRVLFLACIIMRVLTISNGVVIAAARLRTRTTFQTMIHSLCMSMISNLTHSLLWQDGLLAKMRREKYPAVHLL